ncbi:MAG: YHS domain-containing protein [Planctomycetes bacterium]|nr:YHS domain-containing protein [Planctomycetota bacterium]
MIRFGLPWLLLGVLLVAIAVPMATRERPTPRCPLCGMTANPDRVAVYEGRSYFFCDMPENHLARFQLDPEHHLQRMESREADAPVHRDPVCSMDVGEWVSAEYGDRRWYFCSEPCRTRFLADPAAYARQRCPVCSVDDGKVVPVSLDSPWTAAHLGRVFAFDSEEHRRRFEEEPQRYFTHTMWGIPKSAFIGSLGGVILVSFLALGIAAMRRRPVPPRFTHPASPPRDGPRFDLLRWRPLMALAASRWTQRVARLILVIFFGGIVAAGLFGSPDSAENIAPILTWTIWWGALVVLILYGGHIWCYACPWDTIAGFLQMPPFLRDRFRRPFTLGLRWPRWGRSVLLASVCLIVFSWVELGFHVSVDPRLTAYIALVILGMAILSALVFERRSFCRYGCFVGRTIGMYAGIGGVELRHRDTKTCLECRSRDCFAGNDKGAPCPTWEFPGAMQTSTYCLLCAECLRTCPHDNISLFLRPWGGDAEGEGKPRMDEAILVLVILGITAFHGLTMTPAGRDLAGWFGDRLHLGALGGYTVALSAAILGPILVFAALVWVGKRISGESTVSYRTQFIRFAYVHLPIALFYHLAHTSQHLFAEGVKAATMISDPFGWGMNLFGTAEMKFAPFLSLAGVWNVQVACVVIGHLFSLWMADRAAHRMFSSPAAALRSQIPTLIVQVIFSAYSLWLLLQPMEMRTSAM